MRFSVPEVAVLIDEHSARRRYPSLVNELPDTLDIPTYSFLAPLHYWKLSHLYVPPSMRWLVLELDG